MINASSSRPSGMFAFTIIWLGQIISVLASAMSQFGLTILMYQETERALTLGWMQVAYFVPFLVISPLAGVWIDRYNRKLMMMVSDLASGLATLGILALLYFNAWQPWHMYVASAIYGLGMAFQWPAYSAAISTMIPKEQLGRVNGMMSLIEAGPGVIAPILAGALLSIIQLTGILFIDVVTFILAIGTLAFVHIPQPPRTAEGAQASGGILKESLYGFKYIFARPSLLGLQLVFFVGNLFTNIAFTVMAPMILSRSNLNPLAFGSVQTAGAIAGLVGGVVMSVWGGFKRRVHGVLIGWLISGIGIAIVGLKGGLTMWIIGSVISSIVIALVNGSNQAIWQAKVAPDLQGRVFASRRLIAWLTTPIAPIIAGVLADYVLEPAARLETGLPLMFSSIVGLGAGSGMSLLIFFCGLGAALVGVLGYFVPAVLQAETRLPDHDALEKSL